MISTQDLVAYLNQYLSTDDVRDYKDAFNGLQVEGPERVRRVALAVDACSATIEMASVAKADMLLVHHGLFWGSRAPVTGAYFRKLSGLIRNGIALYSSHLPLDVHPEVGNNYVLSRLLELSPCGSFGEFEGRPIGVFSDVETGRTEFFDRVSTVLGVQPVLIAAGSERIRRIGVLTGGGGSLIGSAARAGIDMFITGEGAHHTYFDAEDLRVNVIYAGHYATETVGVKALGRHLTSQFGLECLFLDHPTGL